MQIITVIVVVAVLRIIAEQTVPKNW